MKAFNKINIALRGLLPGDGHAQTIQKKIKEYKGIGFKAI